MSLNSTPATFIAGQVMTAANWNLEVRDAITGIQAVWTTYTPVWTAPGANPTLGNGTITGRYLRMGKTLVACEIIVTIGSTTNPGTGAYAWSLPFTLLNGGTGLAAGSGGFTDASAGTPLLSRGAIRVSATTVGLSDATGARVGAASPVVPATGDVISVLTCSMELA
jgi:hypothetical protein